MGVMSTKDDVCILYGHSLAYLQKIRIVLKSQQQCVQDLQIIVRVLVSMRQSNCD